MNIHVLESEDYWVDLVPITNTINQWNTRFGMNEDLIGEVGGVLHKDQANSILDMIDWGRNLGSASVKLRLAFVFRKMYPELSEMGFEEVFSRGLALLETEND